jgi:hypothetical protein
MITQPVLLCQGLQRAFVDPGGPLFSQSASARRMVCERILGQARMSGWTLIHVFLDSDTMRAAGEATIPGLSPLPSESYFWQRGLSPFGLQEFDRLMFPFHLSPVFLVSYAGAGVISATLIDGIERRHSIHVVTDAAADVAAHGVGESDRLAAIETLARSFESAVTSYELATLAPAPPAITRDHMLSQSGGR